MRDTPADDDDDNDGDDLLPDALQGVQPKENPPPDEINEPYDGGTKP